MKLLATLLLTAAAAVSAIAAEQPWSHGRLVVAPNQRYIIHKDGTPFFWLGNTAWLLPERLDRNQAEYYLDAERDQGYNVEQIQVLNGLPTFNIYGKGTDLASLPAGPAQDYGYWDHLDYIISLAEQRGIYIAMDCIWGGLVKGGGMDTRQAKAYGEFLGRRYRDRPNIIWMIGGDIRGDVKTDEWDALARAIRSTDPNHLMTFHPRGRCTSATWFNSREWLDFNMFQSGHRRYGQRNGDGDYTIKENTEEDNWRYVQMSTAKAPLKPVIDGEPSYEDIPQGLHDANAPRWRACDVRRYAYWAVFAGAFGHTYGHNSIMQFNYPGAQVSFFAVKPWWEALRDPGYLQMKYLKKLILAFPFLERVADQSVIKGGEGERYDYLAATRGRSWMLVYNYSGRPMKLDITKISGQTKAAWWFNPSDGQLSSIGDVANSTEAEFAYDGAYMLEGSDRVLIVTDKDFKFAL